MDNYYQILEISIYATQEDIKKAYRRLAKRYHPDLNDEIGTEEKMKAINAAYETLSDIDKRKAYDKTIMLDENRKAYDSYTKSREKCEEDLEDWLKNYLKRKRALDKLIDEYVKIESRILRTQKHYCSNSISDSTYSQLLLLEIAKEFHNLYVTAIEHPEKILEYLLTEIKILADKIEVANTECLNVPEETTVKLNLFMSEFALFQKNYIHEGEIGYDSILRYVLKRYLKLQEDKKFYISRFRKVPYSNTLQSDMLERIMKDNCKYTKELLADLVTKWYK